MAEELYRDIFKSPPKIETSRLIFRQMTREDAEEMFEYSSTEEVTKYLLWSPHKTLDYTYSYLCYLEGLYRRGEFYDWGVTLKDTGKLIGTGGFTSIDMKNSKGEIGYVLNSDYWHKGYGTEIAKELISFGFNVLGFNRIEARFMVGNDYSLKVMEKCGMQLEGVLRNLLYVKGRYVDVGYSSVLRSEYFQQNEKKEYHFNISSHSNMGDFFSKIVKGR